MSTDLKYFSGDKKYEIYKKINKKIKNKKTPKRVRKRAQRVIIVFRVLCVAYGAIGRKCTKSADENSCVIYAHASLFYPKNLARAIIYVNIEQRHVGDGRPTNETRARTRAIVHGF